MRFVIMPSIHRLARFRLSTYVHSYAQQFPRTWPLKLKTRWEVCHSNFGLHEWVGLEKRLIMKSVKRLLEAIFQYKNC